MPDRAKNYLLLILSLVFYAWGEGFFVVLMLASILTNYTIGLFIDRYREKSAKNLLLIVGLILNLGFLAYFKYANFIVDNLNAVYGSQLLSIHTTHLPIGISFFTFQAMSYVMDVYWNTAAVQRNPLKVGLYIALFPQLIAGPIVRYQDINAQLNARTITLDSFISGIYRFSLGLGKKVLIADVLAIVVDEVFAHEVSQLGAALAWFVLISYALQIFFDFSGYSDMAIGLGMMFGFTLPENFNYPYTAKSIQEFWQRWHISASTWFRLYLFSPLSRSLLRKWGVARRTQIQIISTMTTMLLIGLWHGASWNFVVWGGIFGVFLAIEQSFLRGHLKKLGRLQHIYALFVVLMAWVFFRAATLEQAFSYFARLFSFAGENPEYSLIQYFNRETILVFGLALFLSTIQVSKLFDKVFPKLPNNPSFNEFGIPLWRLGVIVSVMLLSIMSIVSEAYSPFIYFRF